MTAYSKKCGYWGCKGSLGVRTCLVCKKAKTCSSCGRCRYCSNDFQTVKKKKGRQ